MSRIQKYFLMMLCLNMMACGKSGSSDSAPPTPEPDVSPPVTDDFNLVTQVPLNALSFTAPEGETCHSYTAYTGLGQVTDLVIDGEVSEWEAVARFSDPNADSESHLDISWWQFAKAAGKHLTPLVRDGHDETGRRLARRILAKEYFSGTVGFENAATAPALTVVFEGSAVIQGKLVTQVTRRFLFSGGSSFLFKEGDWQQLTADEASYAVQGNILEWAVAPDILGEATYWPLWSVSLQSGESAREWSFTSGGSDKTSVWFYENILDLDHKAFAMKTCSQASSQIDGLVIQEIQESTFTEAQQAAAQKAFDLARAALGHLHLFQKYFELPVSTLAFIATGHDTLADLWQRQERSNQLILPISRLTEEADDFFYEGLLYQHIVRFLIDQQVRATFRTAPVLLRRVMVESLTQHQLLKVLGTNYWLFRTSLDSRELFTTNDRIEPVDAGPISSWAEPWLASSAGQTPEAKAKLSALARLWQLSLSSEELWQVWLRAGQLHASGVSNWMSMYQALEDHFQDQSAGLTGRPLAGYRAGLDGSFAGELTGDLARDLTERPLAKKPTVTYWAVNSAAQIWDGWMTDRPYHAETSLQLFRDQDRDGLPEVLELIFGSSDSSWDSDGDGWTDYAEVALATSPTSAQQYPPHLVADGFLGDWLELLPRKLHVASGKGSAASQCGKAFAIHYFGAYFDQKHLLIAAHSNLKLNENQSDEFSWEVVIQEDKGQKRQFLLSKQESKDELHLRDVAADRLRQRYILPYSAAMSTLEVAIDASALFNGLKLTDVDSSMSEMSLQVRLLRQPPGGKKIYCTHSEWFKAIKYSQAK